MSVFTRERERINTTESLLQSAAHCLRSAWLEITGREREGRGGAGHRLRGQAVICFIKLMWGFSLSIHLFVHMNITFLEQSQFTHFVLKKHTLDQKEGPPSDSKNAEAVRWTSLVKREFDVASGCRTVYSLA